MTTFNRLELTTVLGFYYYAKGKNVEQFTKAFNSFFNKDISPQTILFINSKFGKVDPANNYEDKMRDSEYSRLWDEYIERGNHDELKKIYVSLKNGTLIKPIESLISDGIPTPIDTTNRGEEIILDLPKEKPKGYHETGLSAYTRRHMVASRALAAAGYKCETQCSTLLFKRMDQDITYTEAHHLIPLCFQDYFEYSLDVEANIVSLCPNCHRHLHYGDSIEEVLEDLYRMRESRLALCGISISFQDLRFLYRYR